MNVDQDIWSLTISFELGMVWQISYKVIVHNYIGLGPTFPTQYHLRVQSQARYKRA